MGRATFSAEPKYALVRLAGVQAVYSLPCNGQNRCRTCFNTTSREAQTRESSGKKARKPEEPRESQKYFSGGRRKKIKTELLRLNSYSSFGLNKPTSLLFLFLRYSASIRCVNSTGEKKGKRTGEGGRYAALGKFWGVF